MILTGLEIDKSVSTGDIVIEPFFRENITTNAYDFTLGDRCCIYLDDILDPLKENRTTTFIVPDDGIVLEPGRLYLFNTTERMGSSKFVPIIRGRSSVGRLGIFINITADLIDLGSINQWTLQLYVVNRVRVYPRMRIGQVTFWKTFGRISLYSGKYSSHTSPVPSLSYMDYKI